MLKKTMIYTDYNGNERTEDFYFNLTKAEVMEMEMGTAGGMQEFLNRIVAEQDSAKIIEMFKKIILKAYGQKSLDGKRFIKSDELSAEFSQTEAYSDLFMELASNAEAASAFINGILPVVPEAKKPAVIPINPVVESQPIEVTYAADNHTSL